MSHTLTQDPHVIEWKSSGVSDEIINANVDLLEGNDLLEWLLSEKLGALSGQSAQYATAPVRRSMEQLAQPALGGWRCQGLSLKEVVDRVGDGYGIHEKMWQSVAFNTQALPKDDWGCFKPDSPRPGWTKNRHGQWLRSGRAVKYEHPQATPTSAFFLDIPSKPRLWLEVLAHAEKWPIVIVEGAKKAGCLLSLGYIAIALPGVAQWNIPKTRNIIPEIAIFAREGREIFICFDQDEKERTRRSVGNEIFKLAAALRRRRCVVKVISWKPEQGKGVDDFVMANGREAFEKVYDSAALFEYWAVKQLGRLTYSANWKCPAGQRYLNGVPFPKSAKFIALKAPKGTGKTQDIKGEISEALDNGQRVLLITHRVQLTQSLCDRTGLSSIYEMLKGSPDAKDLGRYQGYGLCLHSLHANSQAKFRSEDWDDALIVIDECEQVLWEALHSSTCKDNRVAILRSLRDIIDGVLSPKTEGRLIIADADLSDPTINTFRGMAKDYAAPPWVAVSDYKGNGCHVTSYESIQQLLAETEAKIEAGEKLFVITDSQKAKGRFSTTSLETRWEKLFSSKRILRIDSDTLACKTSKAYGAMGTVVTAVDVDTIEPREKPSQLALGETATKPTPKNRKVTQRSPKIDFLLAEYDIVIVSPSLETGVSIDLVGHFDRVVGFYQGVMAENSVRQSLARVRENLPRDIYVHSRGLSLIGGGELSAKALEASEHKQVSAALGLIFNAARNEIDSHFLPAATHAYAQFAARQNAGMMAYREIIQHGLKDEGHTLEIIRKPEKDSAKYEELKDLGQELSTGRNQQFIAHSGAISEAEDLTDEEAKRIENARTVDNEAQALALKKHQLSKRYPGADVTPALNILDENGWHSKIRLHYWLTVGRPHLRAADQEKIQSMMSNGSVWAPDARRYTSSTKVFFLEFFKIPALLEVKEVSNHHPQVQALEDLARDHIPEIKAALGFTIAEKDSPVIIASKFLKTVGYRLGKCRRSGPAGDQVRYYPIELADSKFLGDFGPDGYDQKAHEFKCDRTVVFEHWLAKDLDREASLTMAKAKAEVSDAAMPITNPESHATESYYAIPSPKPIVSAGSNRSIEALDIEDPIVEIKQLAESAQVALSELMMKFRDWGSWQAHLQRMGEAAKEKTLKALPQEAIARFREVTGPPPSATEGGPS